MKFNLFFVIALSVLLSCGSKDTASQNVQSSVGTTTNKHAKAVCDCFKDKISFNDDFEEIGEDLQKMDDDDAEEVGECLLKIGKTIEEDLDKLKEKKEKKAYTKSLIKSFVDCECADKLMDNIPFDDFGKALKEAKKELKRMKEPVGDDYPSYDENSYGSDNAGESLEYDDY